MRKKTSVVVGCIGLVVATCLGTAARAENGSKPKNDFQVYGYRKCDSTLVEVPHKHLRCDKQTDILETVRVLKHGVRVATVEGDCLTTDDGGEQRPYRAQPVTLDPGEAFVCWQNAESLAGQTNGLNIYYRVVTSK